MEEGVTELMAHPGYPPSHARTSFGPEREVELAALCSPAVRERVAARGLRLVSWPASARLPVNLRTAAERAGRYIDTAVRKTSRKSGVLHGRSGFTPAATG